MAYPPSSVAANKTSATRVDVDDDHATHHNAVAAAVNDVVAELGTGPKGGSADLTARLSALDTTVAGKQPLDSDLTDIAAIADVAGDILIRGAAGWERLPKGALYSALVMGATYPAWDPTSALEPGKRTFLDVSHSGFIRVGVTLDGGVDGGDTLIGGTGYFQDLTLDSNCTPGKGSILFLSSDASYLAAPEPLLGILGRTITVNYTSQVLPPVFRDTSTRVMTAAGNPGSYPSTLFDIQTVLKNASGVAANLADAYTSTGGVGFHDRSTMQADNAAVLLGIYKSFFSQPSFDVISAGSFTTGQHYGFHHGPSVGAGATMAAITGFQASPGLTGDEIAGTVTTYRGFNAANAILTGAGSVGTLVGFDVQALSSGTTSNIGVRIAKCSTYSLQLSGTDGTAAAGITFGTDTNLYRSAANTLKTDDSLTVDGTATLAAVAGSAFGTGVATFLATPSSANLASAVTGETGSGALVFATSPTLVTPALGTPASGDLSNCTGYPVPGEVQDSAYATVTWASTVSKETLASLTMPAGAPAAGDVILSTFMGDLLSNRAAADTFGFSLEFGGTQVADVVFSPPQSASYSEWRFDVECVIVSTTAQRWTVTATRSTAGAAGATLRSVAEHFSGYATSAINTATAKDLVLYVTHSISNVNVATRFYAGHLSLLSVTA